MCEREDDVEYLNITSEWVDAVCVCVWVCCFFSCYCGRRGYVGKSLQTQVKRFFKSLIREFHFWIGCSFLWSVGLCVTVNVKALFLRTRLWKENFKQESRNQRHICRRPVKRRVPSEIVHWITNSASRKSSLALLVHQPRPTPSPSTPLFLPLPVCVWFCSLYSS